MRIRNAAHFLENLRQMCAPNAELGCRRLFTGLLFLGDGGIRRFGVCLNVTTRLKGRAPSALMRPPPGLPVPARAPSARCASGASRDTPTHFCAGASGGRSRSAPGRWCAPAAANSLRHNRCPPRVLRQTSRAVPGQSHVKACTLQLMNYAQRRKTSAFPFGHRNAYTKRKEPSVR